jgi:hypothetical protein
LRETVPGRKIVRVAGDYGYWTLVVLLLGSASRPNAPQRNRDPNTFFTAPKACLFSAKGAAFSASLGQRPRIRGTPNNVSAEGAIHFALGLRNHLLNWLPRKLSGLVRWAIGFLGRCPRLA